MTAPEPVAALVVAAGSGVRLGGDGPKALRLLGGEPLVVHALRRLAAGGVGRAVVLVRAEDEPAMTEAVVAVSGDLDVQLAHGGVERQDSVRLGLDALIGSGGVGSGGVGSGGVGSGDIGTGQRSVVLVHDAARPLVDPATIGRVVEAVRAGARAVVPVVPVVDTVRQLDSRGGSHGLDRSRLVAVQTPQGFDLDTLVRAHAHVAAQALTVTDDAGACEAFGVAVTTVAGSTTGLKITHPHDLAMAEAILAAQP